MQTATPQQNLAAIRHHCARTIERPTPSSRRPGMSKVTLSLAHGYNRIGDLELELSIIHAVEFDDSQCDFAEALGDAGYPDLAQANWIRESKTELRALVGGQVFVAEVSA